MTHLSELSLVLEWSLKRELIDNLLNFNQLFYGETLSNDVAKRIETNDKLILKLKDLAKRSDQLKKANEEGKLKDEEKILNEQHLKKRLVLELKWQLREQLINNLISNHFIISNEDSSIEAKLSLIKENNRLIQILLELPVLTQLKYENNCKIVKSGQKQIRLYNLTRSSEGYIGLEIKCIKNSSNKKSIVIIKVLEDSQAFKIGLRQGDKLLKVNGKPLEDVCIEIAVEAFKKAVEHCSICISRYEEPTKLLNQIVPDNHCSLPAYSSLMNLDDNANRFFREKAKKKKEDSCVTS